MSMVACKLCGMVSLPHRIDDCVMNLLLRVKALEDQLGAEAKVAATRKDAGASTSVADDSPVAAPSVSADWWRFHAINCDDRGNKLAADACRLAAAVTRWYGQPNIDGSSLVGIVEKFVRGEKLPEGL